MSFYGNITNTSRTQFQFDRTYSNRLAMDQGCYTDNVFIGRYVLVQYDQELSADMCTIAYQKTDNGVKRFYGSADELKMTVVATSEFKYGVGNIKDGKYIRVPATYMDTSNTVHRHNFDEPDASMDRFYKIVGTDSGTNSIKVELMEAGSSTYVQNYNLDFQAYGGEPQPGLPYHGAFRGYDGTVWQKVYAGNAERYVLVAELNTVVPTFSVSADAPTMSPLIPHFDSDSTNVNYKVHWQPSWGLRVKSAANKITTSSLNDDGSVMSKPTEVSMSEYGSNESMLSDEVTFWTKAGYNPATDKKTNYVFRKKTVKDSEKEITGEWAVADVLDFSTFADEKHTENQLPAAIYYNKAGFNVNRTVKANEVQDRITLEPTGKSGHLYNNHILDKATGKYTYEPQVDTQELSIILPSLGNTISDIWDLVYGGTNINSGPNRNLDIKWYDGSVAEQGAGLRLVSRDANGRNYNPAAAQTLAGAINSAHDVIGMIIREQDGEPTDAKAKDAASEYIYYFATPKKYYRKAIGYQEDSEGITGSFKSDERWTPVTFADWPSINTTWFWKDQVKGNTKPNYMLENTYYPDRAYYNVAAPANSEKVSFEGAFEPYKYFVMETGVAVGNTTTTVYSTSLDLTYDVNTHYLDITHTLLGENVRIYKSGGKTQYYSCTFKKDENPSEAKFNSDVYYVQEAIDGGGQHYVPAKRGDATFSAQTSYYDPTFSPAGNSIDPNTQYYMLNAKTEGNYTIVEHVTYTRATSVNESNFGNGVYYTYANGVYTLATSYEKGKTYYTKSSTWSTELTMPGISAANAVEVKLVNYRNDTYYSYMPKNKFGYPQYTKITEALIEELPDNICTIVPKEVTTFYVPNVYYYKIEDAASIYNGSWVIDVATKPTEGRQYYKSIGAVTGGTLIKAYESDKYYTRHQDAQLKTYFYTLATGDKKDPDASYYAKKPLFVSEDTTGQFPVGMEWNLNVTTVPSGVTLKGRTEKYVFEELPGLGKTLNTMHGLLLRINDILEDGNKQTRRHESVQGVINQVKDLIAQIGFIVPQKFIISDEYGRITSGTPVVDNWLRVQVKPDRNALSVKFEHLYPDGGNAQGDHTIAAQTPNFDTTFNIPNIVVDAKGHVTHYKTSTVKLHALSLAHNKVVSEQVDGNGATVLVAAGLTAATGAFSYTTDYVGNRLLTGYTEQASAKLAESDSINKAFGKLQGQINAMDASSTCSSAEVFTTITQVDGKITTLSKTNVTNKIITGYEEQTAAKLAATDSLGKALGKLQGQINALNGSSNANSNQVAIGFSESEGIVSLVYGNITGRTLAGYAIPETVVDVAAGQTLGAALGNLQGQINNLNASGSSTDQVATGFTETKGIMALTYSNVGTRKLTGYTTASISGTVAATDTLNVGLAKLQNLIGTTTVASQINAKMNAVSSSAPSNASVATSISGGNGTVTLGFSNVGGRVITGYTTESISGTVAATDTINTALAKLQNLIGTSTVSSQISTAVSNAVNALDVATIGSNTQLITSVTETNGKISATTMNISALSIAPSQINAALATTQIPTLDASKIGSGKFEVDRIPDLSASKITSGTFALNKLGAMTGYGVAESTTTGATYGDFTSPTYNPVKATDTVGTAIRKLEMRIRQLEKRSSITLTA